ncbi:hypothetical protein [Mycoplasma sp. 3686d]|uniref:hypothetical protein n=1 Tax=Mycoplasma sp. 3686d TaxID=2967300 RepID=UPI00211D007A|nr:hypothetical protein [Mycoplasma sp. 3686d]UUM24543.1 hypothetical protein NPA12_02475 [Mycoplasma sp. 3686d]
MLQPKDIQNKKIPIFDIKFDKTDFIFIIVSGILTFAFSCIFLFGLWILWVLLIFVIIWAIVLIWGLTTNSSELRHYKQAWYFILYSLSSKEYKIKTKNIKDEQLIFKNNVSGKKESKKTADITQTQELEEQEELTRFSPFQSVKENGKIIYDNETWILIELKGFNIWKFSAEEINRFQQRFNSFIYTLKRPFKIIKLNLKNNYQQNIEKLEKTFNNLNDSQKNETFFKNYYVNYEAEIKRFETHFSTQKHSYFLLVNVHNDFESELSKLKSSLNLIDVINPIILQDQEQITQFFNAWFYGEHKLEEEQIKYQVSLLKINKNSFDIDNKRIFTSTLVDVPINLNDSFIKEIFENENSNVVIDCEPIDDEFSTQMLDKAIKILDFESQNTKSNVKSHGYDLEHQALQNYVDEFHRFNVSMLQITLNEYISIDTTNKEEQVLKQEEENILNQIKARNDRHKLKFDYWYLNQQRALENFLKLKETTSDKSIIFSSLNLARTWPFAYEYFNDQDYFILAQQTYSNGLIFFDDMKKTFKRPSSSMFFIGETGSGKTAAISKVALKHILKNDRVLFIDPNNDYSKITNKANGQVVNLNDISKFKTNLLELKNDYYLDDNGVNLHKTSNKSIINKKLHFLSGLFIIFNEQITQSELDFLSLLIYKVYDKAGFTNEQNDIEKLEPITFQDVIEYADNLDIKELSKLKNNIYTQNDLIQALRFLQNNFDLDNGKYSYFNTKQVINFSGNIVSYNLQSILNSSKKEAEIICYILISNFNKAIIDNLFYNIQQYGWEHQDKWRSIVIIVDEIHKFIGGAGGLYLVSFLFDAIKTLRKFWGLLIQGTQSFKDFVLNENIKNLTKQLLEQTQYKFVLKISQEDIKFFDNMLPDTAKLLQSEKDYISGATVGEAIFLPDSSNKQMIRFFYNDYEKKLIFRTNLQQ